MCSLSLLKIVDDLVSSVVAFVKIENLFCFQFSLLWMYACSSKLLSVSISFHTDVRSTSSNLLHLNVLFCHIIQLETIMYAFNQKLSSMISLLIFIITTFDFSLVDSLKTSRFTVHVY